ncbi:MAG: DEAD/DEAH box helicase, partial [Clostridia bacterium]|nr:DEAD/DEAH box helicase [Clostridia bacterium]
DQLRRDVKAYENIELSHVLLDEAQNIKNASSQAARAVKTLRARHRFAMTGTPIENRLSELWSIFDFLMPGYLLTYKKFKERFEAPVVREADEHARENLHRMVAPFILRRMKKDVLSDLPEKIETDMSSEMTPEQRRLYAAYCAQLLRESEGGLLDGGDRIRMLAGLTRLRQLCCDPRLCLEGYKGGSGKLEQLLEIVREALGAGHRLLVFSQFTSMLALIGEALASEGVAYLMLTGETEKDERMELVSQFNADSAASGADVFLISLKAGGTGLNLTGADVVIHYDPWWNVSAQNQATDRAYRIGQTKNVQVIRLIAAGTVEERILHIQESKKALSDGVLLGEENLFTLDAEQMRDLLRG